VTISVRALVRRLVVAAKTATKMAKEPTRKDEIER